MLDLLLDRIGIPTWRLRGYDAFAGTWYGLPGRFFSEECALCAAQHRLKELEQLQPTRTSGGQAGVQDQVYLLRPDGSLVRCLPDALTALDASCTAA